MIRVRRRRDGRLVVALTEEEAVLLLTLPRRIRTLLDDPDFRRRSVARLFPKAYEDPQKDAEYQKLLGDDLRTRKLEAVDAFEETLQTWRARRGHVEIEIAPEAFELWLGTVNDMRLVLGADLEIENEGWQLDFDPQGPRAGDFALLHWLSWLEESLLEAARLS